MAIYREHMSDEEVKIAEHFERGLTDEELEKATQFFGPASSELLPSYLNRLLQERAIRDGVSEIDIIRKAVEAYLLPEQLYTLLKSPGKQIYFIYYIMWTLLC